jgi:hypothetical protein
MKENHDGSKKWKKNKEKHSQFCFFMRSSKIDVLRRVVFDNKTGLFLQYKSECTKSSKGCYSSGNDIFTCVYFRKTQRG